jgi:DNA-binding IclR family transcriptional regulator
MALAELARELELPKSSAHGLLATLVSLDLARRDADGHFALGPRALQWASAYSLQSDVTAAFLEQTRHPGPLSSETVMLAVLDGCEVVYLACRQGSRPLAVNFRVGGRLPATCTATGKAMLATVGAPALDSLVRAPLARLTRHSITERTTLLRRLSVIQRQGYAVDDEETAEGMQCFGVPVFCAGESRAIAAVAVSLIKAGLSVRRRDAVIVAIRELARHLSHRLGAL